MQHIHQDSNVKDSDLHFTIDPMTRLIRNESGKSVLMQHDHNSERLTFEIPRYVDEHDMSSCDILQIHYINIGQTRDDTNEGIYEVDDLEVKADDQNTVTFSWLVSSNATKFSGSLNFVAHFACSENGEIQYSWDTDIYSGITINSTIRNSEQIIYDYADILEKWKNTLFDINNTGLSEVEKAVSESIKRIEQIGNNYIEEMDSKGDSTLAQSWAVGGTGIRQGEDTNNSRYWSMEAAKEAVKAKEYSESIGNVTVTDNSNVSGQGIGSEMNLQRFLDLSGGRLVESIGRIHQIIPVTLLASKWTTGSTAPYIQTVSVPDIRSEDNPTLFTMLSDNSSIDEQKDYMKAYGIISRGIGVTLDGFVTFKVYEQPEVDITVGLSMLRGDI